MKRISQSLFTLGLFLSLAGAARANAVEVPDETSTSLALVLAIGGVWLAGRLVRRKA